MATALQLTKTLAWSSLAKNWAIVALASRSSWGRMRFLISMRTTLLPSSAKYEAISQPVEPAPMTAMTLGRRRTLMAVSGVRKGVVSRPEIPVVRRWAPVAIMKLEVVNCFCLIAIV